MSHNKLDRFPLDLCECTKLETLSLSNNQIQYNLPREINQLIKLESLFLQGNVLSESNITEHISSCPKLKHIDLSNNRLSDFPRYLPTFLNCLSTSGNPIAKITSPLNLKTFAMNLTGLEVSNTFISSLPEDFSTCSHMLFINLSNCVNITEFPSVLLKFKKLLSLNLSATSITVVPDAILTLVTLRVLSFRACAKLVKFPGKLVATHLVRLEELTLMDCKSLKEPPQAIMDYSLQDILRYMKGTITLKDFAKLQKPKCINSLEFVYHPTMQSAISELNLSQDEDLDFEVVEDKASMALKEDDDEKLPKASKKFLSKLPILFKKQKESISHEERTNSNNDMKHSPTKVVVEENKQKKKEEPENLLIMDTPLPPVKKSKQEEKSTPAFTWLF